MLLSVLEIESALTSDTTSVKSLIEVRVQQPVESFQLFAQTFNVLCLLAAILCAVIWQKGAPTLVPWV